MAIRPLDPMFSSSSGYLMTFTREAVVTKTYVLSDVAMKTVYYSATAAAFAFISMLLLTGLHP
jgi:hypothetical protein